MCRFNFPHPPSQNTLIAEPCEDASEPLDMLKKVRKVLGDACGNDLTLDEVLVKAEISSEQYTSALAVST